MTSPIDLPVSIVSEIIKNSLDDDVLLSKNTKVAFSRIGGVFILYISNLANEICKSKGKSKITVQDVMEAMEKSGFSNFKPDIESLLLNIEKETYNTSPSKKRKNEDKKDNTKEDVVIIDETNQNNNQVPTEEIVADKKVKMEEDPKE